jgi:hypothetical protein
MNGIRLPFIVPLQPTSMKGMDMETVISTGASGANYTYFQALMSDDWRDVPVNYMFARREGNIWKVAYIGQCESAKARLPCHERWAEAVRNYGATHVLNHTSSSDEEVRKREERDLIESHNPPMNVQHRPVRILRGLFP